MTPPANFGGLPPQYCEKAGSRIVIIPVPYDRTSTWMKGADQGPSAIIEASANMELYDIETDSEVYLQGIFTDAPVEADLAPADMVQAVQERVEAHLRDRKFSVVLGGEHSVSIGSIRAHVDRYPGLTVLQLDAHTDLRDEYEGSKYNHACVMARVRELCPIVQVGIRSMDVSEKRSLDRDRIFFAQDIQHDSGWVERVIPKLAEDVYITIDLDAFDPAIMPSTGTPEPGGLSWYEVLRLFRTVCRTKRIVGFDVTELSPHERNKAPNFLAAKLIYTLLSYRFLS